MNDMTGEKALKVKDTVLVTVYIKETKVLIFLRISRLSCNTEHIKPPTPAEEKAIF